MEEIYVVKVRTEPDPARLYPSERRYSALTVGGLGAVHLLLASTSLLLGGLGMALQVDSGWTARYGGGLWLGLAAAAAGASGILAWRRWYVDNNIRWFFICSTVAATTSLLCLIITAAVLATIQEQGSNEIYRTIYYDKGPIHQQHIPQQTTETNTVQELPSLDLQGTHKNDRSVPEIRGQAEDIKNLQPTFYDVGILEKDPTQQLWDSLEQTTTPEILGYSQDSLQHDASQKRTLESWNSEHHELHKETAPKNIQNTDISPDHTNASTDTPTDQGSAIWKQTKVGLDIKYSENQATGDIQNSASMQNDSNKKSKISPIINIGNTTNSESTHIMRIANINANKTMYVLSKLLNDYDHTLDPPEIINTENQFNRSKKSTDNQQQDLLSNNNEHLRTFITANQHIHLMTINNEETQDVTIPSIKYEIQEDENISQTIHTTDVSNQTLTKLSTTFEHKPHYNEVRRGAREVRTVIAINILVASALELAWSLLSASIAWKGMRNYYQHENTTSPDRSVVGLERSLPPPPPCPNNAYSTNKRHKKTDRGVFRKPDIISNHRHCHTGNSIQLATVQQKNDTNRLHVINTASERINIEPYLPMEESTMEYQERVQRFLASNNAVNTNDNGSNVDS